MSLLQRYMIEVPRAVPTSTCSIQPLGMGPGGSQLISEYHQCKKAKKKRRLRFSNRIVEGCRVHPANFSLPSIEQAHKSNPKGFQMRNGIPPHPAPTRLIEFCTSNNTVRRQRMEYRCIRAPCAFPIVFREARADGSSDAPRLMMVYSTSTVGLPTDPLFIGSASTSGLSDKGVAIAAFIGHHRVVAG